MTCPELGEIVSRHLEKTTQLRIDAPETSVHSLFGEVRELRDDLRGRAVALVSEQLKFGGREATTRDQFLSQQRMEVLLEFHRETAGEN